MPHAADREPIQQDRPATIYHRLRDRVNVVDAECALRADQAVIVDEFSPLLQGLRERRARPRSQYGRRRTRAAPTQ